MIDLLITSRFLGKGFHIPFHNLSLEGFNCLSTHIMVIYPINFFGNLGVIYASIEQYSTTMTKVKYRFINHLINPKTEILVIGTFNPDTKKNIADFFYGRPRNFLWKLIPTAFGENSLKGRPKSEKLLFIEKYRIDFIDLILEVDVDEVANYNDGYLDGMVTQWKDVVSEIRKLPNLKRVCLTRKSFGEIPNMKRRVDEIKSYLEVREIPFKFLTTPARFYSKAKQEEWNNFFINDA